MSWAELSRERALEEGSALWIVADLEDSSWAQQINWYLNFQLRKAKEHRSNQISKELLAVVQTWEVEAPKLSVSDSAPLLIASSKLLPNQMTVQLLNRTFESWIESAVKIWNGLNRPTVRIFLPTGNTPVQLSSKWTLPEGVQGTYVLD